MKMAWSAITILLMWLSTSFLDHYAVTCYKLSVEELKLQRQIKLLSKPAVTTIQTKYGDWYNCVDFYEQPGFDHPLLRSRKFDFKMSTQPRVYTNTSHMRPLDIWVNGKGCPPHTVPIRKIKPDDIIRANMAAEQVYNISADSGGGVHEFALLLTDKAKKYYGGGMITSIYHPIVQPTQYSSSRIKFQNGVDSIAVGWTVNPSLYPDNGTHYFIYTQTKDSQCYNTYCPGFILQTTDVPLDMLLEPYSKPGGPLYEEKFFVYKDLANGDWFLQIGFDNMTVGTWPQRIFTGLSDSANYVEWGGEVYSPINTVLPPMGAGCRPDSGKIIDNGYGIQVNVINDENEVDYNPSDCSTYNSSPDDYKLIDVGYHGGDIQRVILFGGTPIPI